MWNICFTEQQCLISRLWLAIKRCKRHTLKGIAVFFPITCNICILNLQRKSFLESLRNERQFATTFPPHLQCQGIWHRIFNYYFLLSCLFCLVKRKISPGTYWSAREVLKKTPKSFKWNEIWETNFLKKLCSYLQWSLLFFFILRKHIKNHTICQVFAIVHHQLSA